MKGWPVELFLGNAEALPYRDNSFESVFHVGGINFFNDKRKAIEEMIRIAKPGARILIADETDKGVRTRRSFPVFPAAWERTKRRLMRRSIWFRRR